MDTLKNFIIEALDKRTDYDKALKKLFKPYGIKIELVMGVWDPYSPVLERSGSCKYNGKKISFIVNADFGSKTFNIMTPYVITKKTARETYNFINGKWEREETKNVDCGPVKTQMGDISTAFSDENKNDLFAYITEWHSKIAPNKDKMKQEMDKRLQRVTPKIISLIEKQKNDTPISYNELIDRLFSYEDLSKTMKNKIKSHLNKYKSNEFISLYMEDADLEDLIIYDGWDPEFDSSVIDFIELDESCVSIHKYGDYIIINMTVDIEMPEYYLVV